MIAFCDQLKGSGRRSGVRRPQLAHAADRVQKVETMKHSFDEGTDKSLWSAMSQIVRFHITRDEVLAFDCDIAKWMEDEVNNASCHLVKRTVIRQILDMWTNDSPEEKLKRDL